MASALPKIYDVSQENYVNSSMGELGARFLSTYEAIIIVFSDHTVMLENRTDIQLCIKMVF